MLTYRVQADMNYGNLRERLRVKEEDTHEAGDASVWDLDQSEEYDSPRSKHSPSDERVRCTPTVDRTGRPKEAYDVVYVHCSNRLHFAMILGGAALGMLLTVWAFHLFGPKDTLSTGVSPIVATKSLPGLTPDQVKSKLGISMVFHEPMLTSDITLYCEHSIATDIETENILLCNIYEDVAKQQVYGIELTVDASARPTPDDDKIQDASQRFFEKGLPIVCNDIEVAHIAKWLKPVLRRVRRAGAVCETSFGHIRYFCSGTSWTRTLVITPK